MSKIKSIKKIGSNFIITFRFYVDVIKAVKKEIRILKSLQKQPMPNVISKRQTHTVITSIRENKYSVYNVLLKKKSGFYFDPKSPRNNFRKFSRKKKLKNGQPGSRQPALGPAAG